MHLIDRFKSGDPIFGQNEELRLKLLKEAALEANNLAKSTNHIVKMINFLQNYEDDEIKIETIYETSISKSENYKEYINGSDDSIITETLFKEGTNKNELHKEYISYINVYSKRNKSLVYQTDFDGSCSVLLYIPEKSDNSWEKHLIKVYNDKVKEEINNRLNNKEYVLKK